MGGDYEKGGSASSRLKEMLKRIGADPADVRRAIVAAYEAEMNVVIHAYEGEMRFAIDAGQLNVEVTDSGPGIPDIEKAMQEGYSTAPPVAREMGFGAGMGLPNIRRNTDSLDIRSGVGGGTIIGFSVHLRHLEAAVQAGVSACTDSGLCNRCMLCLRSCPTKALRIRRGGPEILRHLCIDCAECIRVCPTGALRMERISPLETIPEGATLVLQPPALVQFPFKTSPESLSETLVHAGYKELLLTIAWEDALRDAVIRYARREPDIRPIISPACPVILNLITVRFPSLTAHVAPFLSPLESVRESLRGSISCFVPLCPGQLSALKSDMPEEHRLIPVSQLLEAKAREEGTCQCSSHDGRDTLEDAPVHSNVLTASGMPSAVRLLEQVENGALEAVEVVEVYACPGGCFGSPLLHQHPDVAQYCWSRANIAPQAPVEAAKRSSPLLARAGMRLDPDMAEALNSLARVQEIAAVLPGRDCGMCGAPTCSSLAIDIVMGRAGRKDCIYLSGEQENRK
jgi:anti-sigma regulatory factor (Ser/Thr protein kinase)/Fe-S-cluster-containing hydrogenase component 2